MRSVIAYDRANPIFSVNLTMQQLKVLMLVSRSPDGMTSQDLTRHMGVSLATMSGIVDRLVAHAFVSRHEDPRDRRIRRIRLTAEGRKVLHEIMDQGQEVSRRVLDRLDDDTLRMLETVLHRVIDAVIEDAEAHGVKIPAAGRDRLG